jgi:hypothetical protein
MRQLLRKIVTPPLPLGRRNTNPSVCPSPKSPSKHRGMTPEMTERLAKQKRERARWRHYGNAQSELNQLQKASSALSSILEPRNELSVLGSSTEVQSMKRIAAACSIEILVRKMLVNSRIRRRVRKREAAERISEQLKYLGERNRQKQEGRDRATKREKQRREAMAEAAIRAKANYDAGPLAGKQLKEQRSEHRKGAGA